MKNAKRLGVRWHDERRRKLFADHPTVRGLMGRNPWTGAIIIALVATQLSVGVAVAEQPWWVLVLLGYFLGAFVAHALGVLIHEATHDLVFASPSANRWLAMLANAVLVFPAAMDFRDKHLKHHAHLGEPDGADTQAPREWEFGFATTRLRTLVWFMLAPLLSQPKFSRWIVANFAVHLAVLVPYGVLFGPWPLFFLGVSALSAFAPHPVGIRRYGEHLTLAKGQPTASYYGLLNWLSFDVGYHVEHHDLPSVPWNRLRQMNALAPELYRPLAFIPSWGALLWRFVTARGEGPEHYFLEGRDSPSTPLEPTSLRPGRQP